jgi:NADH-quinone oxidoreductase subunit N
VTVPALDGFAMLPVILPAVAVIALLLAEACAPDGVLTRRIVDGLAGAGLAGGALAVAWLASAGAGTAWGGADGAGAGGLGTGAAGVYRATACQPAVSGATFERCSYVVSSLTLSLQAVILLGALGCLLLARDGAGARDRAAHHTLLLTAAAGAAAAAAGRDLATLVIAVEVASLPVIALVGLRREAAGAQAAVTLLLTAVTSLGLLLMGVALLYAATGDLYLEAIAQALSAPDLPRAVLLVASLGVVLAVAGLGFKVSAVPFHLWTPDTYAGAPLPVAAFLAVVSKAAGFAAIVVLLAIGVPALVDTWAPVIGVVAVATMTVGNVIALRQRIAVRLLAWSTVAQAGWVLLPLAAAPFASPRSAVAASVAYLAAYAAGSLLVFAVVVLVARHHRAGEEHTINDYRGLVRREPVATAALVLGLVSLAGLPPGVLGLVAKVLALRPLVDGRMWLLALIAVANVAIGVVYYLRWAALTLVAAPSGERAVSWRVRPAEGAVLGGAFALVIMLSLLPGPLADAVTGVLR